MLCAIIARKQQISERLMQPITRHPDRMNIHLARYSLISTAYAAVLVSSTFKRNAQHVLVSNWQSRLRGGRTLWSSAYLRLADKVNVHAIRMACYGLHQPP